MISPAPRSPLDEVALVTRLDALLDATPRPDVLYFAGCTVRFARQRDARLLQAILRRADLPVRLMVDEPCCGGELFHRGHEADGIAHGRQVLAALNAEASALVVTTCPECFYTLAVEYPARPEITPPLAAPVVHVTTLVDVLLKRGRLQVTTPVKGRYAYLDPCHLGRYAGVYEAPRAVLQATGARVANAKWTRDFSWCCGGPIREPFVELRNALCQKLLKTGKRVVTACPTCEYNLRAVKTLFEDRTEVHNVLDLVAHAVGLTTELGGPLQLAALSPGGGA